MISCCKYFLITVKLRVYELLRSGGGDESRTLVNILIKQRIYVLHFINTTLSTTLVPKNYIKNKEPCNKNYTALYFVKLITYDDICIISLLVNYVNTFHNIL